MATLYFHIPFCKRICSYCDFYKVGALELLPRVVDNLHHELDRRSDYLSERRLTSIYFGGGTPSLLHPNDIEQLINHAREIFDCSTVEEITIEANPDDITEEYAENLAKTSVNRVSLGIQSFDDEVLRFMNRRHTGAEAEEAVKRLRAIGINNISIDIIFGVAGFANDHLGESLRRAIALDVEHISAYHLTVEERTRLGLLVRKGEYTPISDEESEGEFLRVHDTLADAGYDHYEVSNFAKQGQRARHNSAYWQGIEYLGIGPGAHSFSGDNRTWCISSAKEYAEGNFLYEGEELSTVDHYNEYIMTSLRTSQGIDIKRIAQRFGDKMAAHTIKAAQEWIDSQCMKYQNDRLAIPATRFLISDAIIESFFV
ncbi:MAG: radical SAM family heme chaperone HemW [Alistipes sp.]|nr:radical SAM family heme chaperone HemW [Alistipes sp.]